MDSYLEPTAAYPFGHSCVLCAPRSHSHILEFICIEYNLIVLFNFSQNVSTAVASQPASERTTQPQVYIATVRVCWFLLIFLSTESSSSSLGCLFWYISRPFSVSACVRPTASVCLCVYLCIEHISPTVREWVGSFFLILELVFLLFSFSLGARMSRSQDHLRFSSKLTLTRVTLFATVPPRRHHIIRFLSLFSLFSF